MTTARLAFGFVRRLLAALAPLAALVPASAGAQPSFLNFESGHVRPLAPSADGERLFVVNTPDARLEIFDVTGAAPTPVGSVPVGLEPVAVAVESPERVWVVNHLSDSVSVVDVASDPPRVVRTLPVGDEPRDIVFAGPDRRRAFVTTAHRGAHAPHPEGETDTPGVGRADVWVFDADGGDAPLPVLTLFGDTPRALAVSPDGTRVYAAVFLSGNRTTTVSEGAVCDGGPSAGPCTVEGVSYPGGLPPPFDNHAGVRAPETGLIVRQPNEGGPWLDELGRDWSAAVRFSLPDHDVFAIDATADPPVEVEAYAGVGTVLFGMATHPVTGELYVANTEARNEVRFEGPGDYVRSLGLRAGQPASVRGHLHEARVTRIAGSTVTPVHLNPHIDYDASPTPDVRWRSLATPVSLAFDADGDTLYVAALGSSAIGVIPTAQLESGAVDADPSRSILLREPWPGGPTGVVVDDARERLYVTTRFDNALVTIDLRDRSVVARTRMCSPEDEATVVGRPILYDALATSSNGEAACASCHVFGDLDGLAWDLGDPDADVMANPNPIGPVGTAQAFHPMKGPMATQSLRGLADHGPMHWRGDRTAASGGGDPLDERGAFEAFNPAFDALLGREEGPLSDEEMRRFAEFALRIVYPPNPIRRLDNQLRPDEQRGSDLFGHTDPSAPRFDAVATCNGCHSFDRAQGFFGSGGLTTFENEPQEMKVAHLRNLYQKVGMFGMPSVPFLGPGDFSDMGPQVRGFGFLHDGSIDTLDRFFRATVFSMSDAQRRDMVAFMMAFDSLLPPIVGQQVTVSGALDTATRARLELLIARAQAPMIWPGAGVTTECDLVAHAIVGGEARGYLLRDGAFQPDRAGDGPVPLASLDTAIATAEVVTFTCVPPGSGERMARDRDEDGILDGDDPEPAGRVPFAIPALAVAPPDDPSPPSDGGSPTADAGVDAPRPDGAVPPGADAGPPGGDPSDGDPSGGGCGCRVGGAAGTTAPAGLAGLVWLALAWRRRRSKKRVGGRALSARRRSPSARR